MKDRNTYRDGRPNRVKELFKFFDNSITRLFAFFIPVPSVDAASACLLRSPTSDPTSFHLLRSFVGRPMAKTS